MSGGDPPSRCGSAGKTVVVDGVNVFLDFLAVRLGIRRRSAVAVAIQSGAIGFPASRDE